MTYNVSLCKLCNILSSLSTSGPHTSRNCLYPERLTPAIFFIKTVFLYLFGSRPGIGTQISDMAPYAYQLSTQTFIDDLIFPVETFSPQKVDSGPTDRQFRQVNGGELTQPVKQHDTGPRTCEYWYFIIRVITCPAYCKGVTYTDQNLYSPWKQSIVTERC